jgi:hypothetical protein
MATAEQDWTKNDQPKNEIDLDNLVLPTVVASKTADEIEAEGGAEDIEPGTYELECLGWGSPRHETKDMFLDGQRLTLRTISVRVRFCLPDDKGKQVSDFLLLPPGDPDSLHAWENAATKKDEKTKGFWRSKYIHLVERLFGVVIPKGAPLPDITRYQANWKGKRVIAKVEPGNEYEKTVKDTTTGMESTEKAAGRNGIALYSYRATDATKANYRRPAAAQAQQQASPGAAAAQPRASVAVAQPAAQQARPASPVADPSIAQIAGLKAAYQQAIDAEDFDEAKAIKAQLSKLIGGTDRGPTPQTRPTHQRQPEMAGAGAGNRGLDDL